jgi:broad specificity phosphatase PhoE
MRGWIGAGVLWAVLLPAQAENWQSPPADGLLLVVVRHAEKASAEARDPDLSAAGQVRAQALAERLRELPLAAVYATPFRRTQLTAWPSAETQGIEVEVRDFVSRNPDEDALALRETLLREHRGEAVLVVGHSNTVPAIVEALSGQDAEAMPETEYDRLSLIRIESDGRAELRVERY